MKHLLLRFLCRPALRILIAIFFIATNALFTPALAQFFSQTSGQAVVTTERVRAELMAYAPDGVAPGKEVWLGLQLAHQPEWHTYWKNAGDSGLPTQLQWSLPAGVSAGEIAWPVPRKIRIGNLANYGYEGTVLLAVPLTIGPGFRPGLLGNDLDVKLHAVWLVCRKECIPEEGDFALRIPLKSSTALNAQSFQSTLQALPRPVLSGTQGGVPESTARVEGQALQIRVQGLPLALRGQTLDFFPETPELIETAAPWSQAWQGAVWTASVPLSPQRSASPRSLPVVLAGQGQGWRAELAVQGTWPAAAQPIPVPAALSAALAQNANMQAPLPAQGGSLAGLALALLGALLGGMVLNLMPCVFPVLAIKVLGFAQHADDRRSHRLAGLAYTAGVVLSFVALGGLMLALRAGGEALGWGFQLQSPAVVAALALLFTLIGLNLAGVFELGQFLPSGLASLNARNPIANALLSGVLAVAIASPCTAPFMGASLGLAVTLPPLQALLLFACVGLGMALPYLGASLVPGVARLLPRPGAWMLTLRRLMAFPIFATVAWLVWVLGQQSGIDGAGTLLGLLVAVSSVAWALSLTGRSRLLVAPFLIAITLVFMLAVGPNITKIPETGSPTVAAGERWQPWEPGRAEQVLAQGHSVFVDFTAAWCVTCQYNKKAVLSNSTLLADMDAKHIRFLRADWTRRDPAITAALGQLGRSGVPVYVFYAPGKAPVVLSEVLTVDEVRAAVRQL